MAEFTITDLKDVVSRCLGAANATDVSDGALDTSMTDLGYDSLAVYEIATTISEDLGTEIPDTDIDLFGTPRAILNYVNGRQI